MQLFLLLASKDLVSIVTQPILTRQFEQNEKSKVISSRIKNINSALVKTNPLQFQALNVKSRTKSGQVEILFYPIARIKTSAQQIVN